jgi:hypothetical protein
LNQSIAPIAHQTLAMPATNAEIIERIRVVIEEVRAATIDELCDVFALDRPISFEPGHLMSWEKYRELEQLQGFVAQIGSCRGRT